MIIIEEKYAICWVGFWDLREKQLVLALVEIAGVYFEVAQIFWLSLLEVKKLTIL